MDGVIEVADVDNPHSHTDEGDDLQGGASREIYETFVEASFQAKKSLFTF